MADVAQPTAGDGLESCARSGPAKWLRLHSHPLSGLDPTLPLHDLEPLREMIGDARAVSLGEATHGTREFFQLKHRILRFCVTELGFRGFGIEDQFVKCLPINRYVLTGQGDPREAVRWLFHVWSTEEVLELVEWMREWNAGEGRAAPVTFFGFDMQFPTLANRELLRRLAVYDRALFAEVLPKLRPLCLDGAVQVLRFRPEAERQDLATALALVNDELAARDAPVELRLLARTTEQAAGRDDRRRSRDEAMAENAVEMTRSLGPGGRVVLWSHNGHASRLPLNIRIGSMELKDLDAMGHYLDGILGPDHVNLGFAFGRGRFRSGSKDGVPRAFDAPPLRADSLERHLDGVELPLFLADLRRLRQVDGASEWFKAEPSLRWHGGYYDPEHADTSFTAGDWMTAFDLLIYVARASASRGLFDGEARPRQDAHTAPPGRARNLDWGRLDDAGIPSGWTVELGRGASFEVPEPGRLWLTTREDSHCLLTQSVNAESLRPRVRLRCPVEVVEGGPVTQGSVTVTVLRKPDGEGPFRQPQLVGAAVCLDGEEAAVEVPHDADLVALTVSLSGAGRASFGPVSLRVG